MNYAVDETGDGYVYSEGPWWIDPNHSSPGAGYLNLLAVQYATVANVTEFTDLSLTFAISLEDFTLPENAELYVWIQGIDQNIPWGNGDRVNYVNVANPLSALVGLGGETTVTIDFRAIEEDWLALGSSLQIDESYSTSDSIADALASYPIDFGIIALLGNDVPPVAATGTVRIDDVEIVSNGPLRAQVFADEGGPQLLNLSVQLDDIDGATFQGSTIRVAPTAALDSGLALIAESDFGLVIDEGAIYLNGEQVAEIEGGNGGEALSIRITSVLDAAALELLISRLALIPSEDDIGAAPFTLELEDVEGNLSSLDIVVRVRPPLYQGEGDDLVEGTNLDDGLRGGAGQDTILGFDGNDRLYGGSGNDELVGGRGDDLYFVDDAGDVVFELADEGRDTVFASVNYILQAGAFVEALSAASQAGFEPINLVGNEFANLVVGNAGANTLRGGAGNDGLYGLGGNDSLIGDAGDDSLVGGLGDDFYFVDAGDVVFELADEGRDIVYAATSYSLTANAHIEALSTATQADDQAIDLTGNEFAQLIVGNRGVNQLRGAGGGDTLVGLEGNDSLIGGSGNDITVGGAGDDFHFVEDAGDIVIEKTDGGRDIVYASVSYRLSAGAHVEGLSTAEQAATDALNLTGNEFSQLIVGNEGANRLRGDGGDDTLIGLGGDDVLIGDEGVDVTDGGLGNDHHYVDNTADRVIERADEGRDIVYASVSYRLEADVHVEALSTSLQAGTEAIDLTGNAFAQLVVGNAGANVLDGDLGADTLVGLEGDDRFVFATALGSGNVDTIADFVSGQDTIGLKADIFGGLGFGGLAAGAFVVGTVATDVDDRILYDSGSGRLFFDSDGTGSGAAIQFARLAGSPDLAAADFIVI